MAYVSHVEPADLVRFMCNTNSKQQYLHKLFTILHYFRILQWTTEHRRKIRFENYQTQSDDVVGAVNRVEGG